MEVKVEEAPSRRSLKKESRVRSCLILLNLQEKPNPTREMRIILANWVRKSGKKLFFCSFIFPLTARKGQNQSKLWEIVMEINIPVNKLGYQKIELGGGNSVGKAYMLVVSIAIHE